MRTVPSNIMKYWHMYGPFREWLDAQKKGGPSKEAQLEATIHALCAVIRTLPLDDECAMLSLAHSLGDTLEMDDFCGAVLGQGGATWRAVPIYDPEDDGALVCNAYVAEGFDPAHLLRGEIQP